MRAGYGGGGRIGIGVPQANPTVEAEFAILLPRRCTTLVTRLTSSAASPAERLVAYLERLDEALARYDTLRPDIFGFACTGSSYLVGAAREARIVAAAEARYGYPVVTATAALRWALARVGARRIALVAPYPADLTAAAERYWRDTGLELVSIDRVDTGATDTRSIYALAGDEAAAAVAAASARGVDAVLLTGTGMPTLVTIAAADTGGGGPPLVSSNLALAGAVLERRAPGTLATNEIVPPDWAARLADTLND